jgi:SAM-dependent methyltransferase
VFGLEENYPYWDDINEGILRNLPPAQPGQQVLDVGCGRAALGEAIRNLGYEVWGVENAPSAVAVAKGRIDRLIERDLLDRDNIARALSDTHFDYLVFSDVLEHVYDPVGTLKFYRSFLKPTGSVLVSVPNALAWLHRLEFLLGRFQYRDSGILDRTHVRFFTFRNTRELARCSGLTPVKMDCTPFVVRAFLPLIKRLMGGGKGQGGDPSKLLQSRPYRIYLRWIYPLEYRVARLFRGLLSFRIVMVADAKH